MNDYLCGAAIFIVVASAHSADAPLTYYGVFGHSSLVYASAIDAAGNVYVAGLTYGDVGVTPGALQTGFRHSVCGYQRGLDDTFSDVPCPHGFVAKIDPGGTRP